MILIFLCVITYFLLGVYALIKVSRYHISPVPDGPQFLLAWVLWPVAVVVTLFQIITTELPKYINRRA